MWVNESETDSGRFSRKNEFRRAHSLTDVPKADPVKRTAHI